MDRIYHPTANATAPSVDSHSTAGYPANATIFTPWIAHQIIEELRGVVVAAGITPDKASVTQLLAALHRLYGGALRTVSSNVTLTAADAGLVLIDSTGGNVTITLPAANAAGARPIRFSFVRIDASANTVTIQRAGSDLIDGATSIVPWGNERIQIASDGAASWRLLAGRITQSIGTAGWQRMPNGLIQQWGSATTGGGGSVTVSFPIAFPNAAFGVTLGSNVSSAAFHSWQTLTTTGFFLQSWDAAGAAMAAQTAFYTAIGN